MLRPGTARTLFEQYSAEVVIPYVKKFLENSNRVDVVFDRYIPNSLKATSRHKRCSGARRRVGCGVKIPQDWHDFLRVDDNKTELFGFLSDQIVQNVSPQKIMIVTKNHEVLCNQDLDLLSINNCNHEEADT